MATGVLGDIFGVGLDLVPHLEARALKWVMRNYVMPARVSVLTDMSNGTWNTRKISEYLPGRIAQDLSENTAIGTTALARTRRAELDPYEVGDRYPISDRRESTDLEGIVSDSVLALGQSVGDRWERDLVVAALNSFIGGTFGTAGAAFTVDHLIDAQYEFSKKRGSKRYGTLYAVLNPLQVKPVMKSLIDWETGTNLAVRENALASWTLPGFPGMNIVQSEFVPRNVAYRVKIDGTGGTFRLSVRDLTTGAITVSATPATTATNIKNALDALSIGTWTVTANGGDNLDIDVTCSTLYLNADEELRVAINPATPTLEGQKSAYDLVTTPDGTPLGTDLAGANYGVAVEEVSASAKALLFYREALALDVRQFPKGHFETTNQGRTANYSLYAKQAIGYWNPVLGMFINSTATSGLAVA